MTKNLVRVVLIVFCGGLEVAAQPVDHSWTFGSDGTVDYRLTEASPEVFSGALPVDDPTLNLQVGKRYQVTVVDPIFHPLQIIAKAGSSTSDFILLSQGATNGTMESDPEVAWTDSDGVVTFTMTQALGAAMLEAGRIPGYRCANHPATMRGNFNVTEGAMTPTPTTELGETPTPTDTVEGVPTFTETATPTDTSPTAPTPTNTLDEFPTVTETATPTEISQVTPTPTDTLGTVPEPTDTPIGFPTITETATATQLVETTASPTPTDTLSGEPTPTDTGILPTQTTTNTPRSADITGDGVVDSKDLLELMRQWKQQAK